MAAKNIQFKMGFSADTSQVKKAIQELDNSLSQIQQLDFNASFDSNDFREAAESAKILQQNLRESVNVDTGKLNLTKFNQSLRESGQSLTDLTTSLLLAGTQGEAAFVSLTKSIAQAEVPLKKTNSLLNNMLTTLKNTVKWELSSTFVHGIEGALSSSVSYIKNLNSSLTDIRIVTGKSTEDMAKFAVQANKAAKELSTTTKAYADASLIYYQQGDNAEMAAKKAAITIKAANSSFNTSAAEMSEYLTSVWNSYQVGADQLERYVDIMAALGAKTATSLEEIATSMQKVAATSNTVGVSMEQVSSIIATVSSVTRESAESIGTSYKTIFARIGDLKLGKTDEDGIGLGQVSSSLESIGVQILDQTGNLRDMGDIITDLGTKWQTMTEAEKTAVAQVVAGKRQYTQLMALFENWDMYNRNLDIAGSAEGSLEKMASTYAESYEAYAARTKAALEDLYDSLLSDKALIVWQAGLKSVIEVITGMIDTLDGIPGILLTIGNIATRVFSTQIKSSIITLGHNITSFTSDLNSVWKGLDTGFGQVLKRMKDISAISEKSSKGFGGVQQMLSLSGQQRDALRTLEENRTNMRDVPSAENNALYQQQLGQMEDLMTAKERMILLESKMTAAEKARISSSIDQTSDQIEQITKLKQAYQDLDRSMSRQSKLAGDRIDAQIAADSTMATRKETFFSSRNSENTGFNMSAGQNLSVAEMFGQYGELQKVILAFGEMSTAIDAVKTSMTDTDTSSTKFQTNLTTLKTILNSLIHSSTGPTKEAFEAIRQTLEGTSVDTNTYKTAVQNLETVMGGLTTKASQQRTTMITLGNTIGTDLLPSLGQIDDHAEMAGTALARLANLMDRNAQAATKLSQDLDKIGLGKFSGFANKAVEAAKLLMTGLSGALSGLNAIDNWDESNLSQKIGSVMSVTGNLISAWSGGLISGIVGTISTVVGAIAGAVKNHFEEIEKRKDNIVKNSSETLTNINEEIEAIKEEDAAISDAYNNYKKYNEERKKTGIASVELTSATTEVIDALGNESLKVLALSGHYDLLAQAIENANNERIKQNNIDAQDAYVAAVNSTRSMMLNASSGLYHDTYAFDASYKESTNKQMQDMGYSEQQYLDLMKYFGFTMIGHNDDLHLSTDPEQILKVYQTIKKFQEERPDMAWLFDAESAFGKIWQHIEKAGLALESTKEYTQTANIQTRYGTGSINHQTYSNSIKAAEDDAAEASKIYDQILADLINEYIAAGADPEAATALARNFISTYFSSVSDTFNEVIGAENYASFVFEEVAKKYGISAGEAEAIFKTAKARAAEQGQVLDLTQVDYNALNWDSADTLFTSYDAVRGYSKATTAAQENDAQIAALTSAKQFVGQKDKTADLAGALGLEQSSEEFQNFLAMSTDAQIAYIEDSIKIAKDKQKELWDEAKTEAVTSAKDLETIYNQSWTNVAASMTHAGLKQGDSADLVISQRENEIELLQILQSGQSKDWSTISAGAQEAFSRMLQEAMSKGLIAEDWTADELWSSINLGGGGSSLMYSLLTGESPDYANMTSEEWYDFQNGYSSEDYQAMIDSRNAEISNLYAYDSTRIGFQGATEAGFEAESQGQVIADTTETLVTAEEVLKNFGSAYKNLNRDLMDTEGWNSLAKAMGIPIEQLQELYNTATDAEWANAMTSAMQTAYDNMITYEEKKALEEAGEEIPAGAVIVSAADKAAAKAQLEEGYWQQAELEADNISKGLWNQPDIVTEEGVKEGERMLDILARNAEQAKILASIDITNLPKAGTKSYTILEKAIAKTGKTMKEFLSLSDEKKIMAIAEAENKILDDEISVNSKLQEHYQSIMNDTTGKYSESDRLTATELYYQAVAEGNELAAEKEQNLANARQEQMSLWQQYLNEIEAAEEKAMEKSNNTKNAADIFRTNVMDGQLTASDRQSLLNYGISEEAIAEWEALGTAEERAAKAAELYSQAMAQATAASEVLLNIYRNMGVEDLGDNLESSLGSIESFSEHLSNLELDEATKGAWVQAYNNAAALGDVTVESLSAAVAELPVELQNEINNSQAGITTAMADVYDAVAKENKNTAEQAVADWEAAFNRIAELRKKILAGEDITGDIFGKGLDNLMQAFKDSGETDYATFSKKVWEGSYKPELPTFDLNEWVGQAGLTAFQGLGANGTNKFGYNDLLNWYKTTKNQEDEQAQASVESDVKTLLTERLGFGKSDYKVDDVWAAYLSGDTTAKFMDENGNLVDAATLIDSAADKMLIMGQGMHTDLEKYTTQEEKRAEFTGAQKEYNKTVAEQQQNISDWQTISEAIAAKDAGEAKSVYEALGDNAGEIMTRLGLSKEDLNNMTQEEVQQRINNAAVAIEKAQVVFGDKLESIGITDAMGNVTEEGKFIEEEITTAQEEAAINTADASNVAADFSPSKITAESFSKALGMTKEEFETYAYTLNDALDASSKFNTETELGKQQLYEYAKVVAKTEEGFDELHKITKDTWKMLKDDSKTGTKEWSQNIEGLRKTMSKIFNVDMTRISSKFVSEHLEDIEKMAKGDKKAFESISDALISEILDKDYDLKLNIDVDKDGLSDSLGDVIDNYEDILTARLGEIDNGMVITPELDASGATQSLLDLLNAGGETAESIQAALQSIGWVPEVAYDEYPVTDVETVSGQVVYHYVDALGNKKTYSGGASGYNQSTNTIRVPRIGSNGQTQFSGLRKTGSGVKKPTASSSGGGGSKPEKKDHKSGEDEIERYHEITEKLEEISQELSQIDKIKARAFGANHLKAIDKEIDALNEELEANRRLKKEAEAWLAFDKGRMQSLGAAFDEHGNITNYDELMQSWLNEYNAAVDAFNRNGDEDAFEDAEELFEKRKKWLENYEESLDKVEDAEDAILEKQNAISAAQLEKITYKVEVVTEINEADIKILEYYNSLHENQLDMQDESLRNLTAQAQEYASNIGVVNEAMAELERQHDSKQINDADYAEGMKELRDQALDYASSLEDLKQQIIDVYANALSLATEEIENHTEKIQHAADMMDSYISILGLLGQGPNYRKLEEFYKVQYQANLANLTTQKAYLDELLAQEQYFKNKTTLTETEQEQYEALQDTIRETREGLVSSTEAALNALQAQYENTINAIFAELDAAIAGTAGSISNLADQYAYYQEEQERYVSTSRELYEISKLNRNIENSIEDAVSSASKAKLKALKDEINLISKKNDLTEYDIELMNLQYELALAQIALEEAQNAKDTVRLTRDANGNYAYQYTADQEKVNAAQQQYEDVLQQINELAANRISELEQQMLTAQQDYIQAAQQILLDTTLTDEQRTARLEELSKRYKDTLVYIQREYGDVSKNLMQNQVAISEWYNTELVNQAGKAQTQMNETIASLIKNSDDLIAAWENALNGEGGAGSALQQFIAAATALTGASGLTYENMTASINDYIAASNSAAQAAQSTIITIGDTLSGLNEATEEWDSHLGMLTSVQEMYVRIAESAQQAIAALSGFDVVNGVIVPRTAPQTDEPAYATGGLNTKTGWAWLDGTANAPELVLNAEQTQDILAATEVARHVIGGETLTNIKNIMAADLQYLMAASALAYHAQGVSGTNGSTIQQTVEIHADFPNVSDSNEIQLAFDELVNRATQYVYSPSTK